MRDGNFLRLLISQHNTQLPCYFVAISFLECRFFQKLKLGRIKGREVLSVMDLKFSIVIALDKNFEFVEFLWFLAVKGMKLPSEA